MIRGQKDREAAIQKHIEKIAEIRLPRPLGDLVLHPGRSHLHPVHDPVDLVHDQPGDPDLRTFQQLRERREVPVAQALGVHRLIARQTGVRPELRPERGFPVRRPDAVREKNGRLSGERRLPRDRRD